MPFSPERDHATPIGVALPRAKEIWWWLTALVVIAASAARLWLAVTDHSIYWPDEIYQSLEQAHRLAFGPGIIPWEFRDGARSWLFPGAIAALWRAGAALGLQSSLELVDLARASIVLASAASLWLGARLAARLAGPRAGLVAALVLGVLPISVVFGFRTLSETASAPFILLAAACVLDGAAAKTRLAGIWAALATWLRYQNALFALIFVAWLLFRRNRRGAIAFCAAAASCALLGGLLDWISWGAPFHSLFVYVDFNLIHGGASTFGVEPVWYYARTLWQSTGPALLPFALCALLGVPIAPLLGIALGAYVLAHSLIPHKELRFLVPCLPLFAVLAGVGAERALQRLGRSRLLGAALLAFACFGSLWNLPRLTFGRLGQYLDTPRAAQSVWKAEEDVNLLLAEAGRTPELCGLGVLGLRPAFTGGYTYFHRDAPLLFADQLCGNEASVNYLMLPRARALALLPAGYSLVGERGSIGLFRRAGSCSALSPNHEWLLDGARDMGLDRPIAAQASDGSFRFDVIRSSGSFERGWGHGELIACKPARWAVGKRATIQFDAAVPDGAYILRAELHPAARTMQQSVYFALNGHELGERALSQPRGLVLDVPPHVIERGRNRLQLTFAETWRPGGDDTRDLAVLLRSLELVPLRDDFDVRIGTLHASDHLIDGFSGEEFDGSLHYVWSDGPASVVEGRLAASSSPAVLSFFALAIAGAAPERTKISINDQPLAEIDVGPDWQQRELIVPPEALRVGKNRVRFEYERTVVPADVDPALSDTRMLALRFQWLRLARLPQVSDIDLGTAESDPALMDGWAPGEMENERSVTWSVGRRSRLRIALGGKRDARLQIEARAYPPALPLGVEVSLNDTPVGSFRPTANWGRHEVMLPAQLFSNVGNILEFRYDHTASPSEHESGSTDQRELAVRFDRIRVTRW